MSEDIYVLICNFNLLFSFYAVDSSHCKSISEVLVLLKLCTDPCYTIRTGSVNTYMYIKCFDQEIVDIIKEYCSDNSIKINISFGLLCIVWNNFEGR